MYMNQITKQVLVAALGFMGFLLILGIAGRYDYASEVLYTMPEEAYYTILDTLGDDATEIAIAEEYMDNKEYYDAKYR